MIVEVLNRPPVRGPFLKLLHKHYANGQNGSGGEERLLMSGVSWQEYLAIDKILGDDRPGPRLYFLDGELEIMSTSLKHPAKEKP